MAKSYGTLRGARRERQGSGAFLLVPVVVDDTAASRALVMSGFLPQTFGEWGFRAQGEQRMNVVWHDDPRADVPMLFGFKHETLALECSQQE